MLVCISCVLKVVNSYLISFFINFLYTVNFVPIHQRHLCYFIKKNKNIMKFGKWSNQPDVVYCLNLRLNLTWHSQYNLFFFFEKCIYKNV